MAAIQMVEITPEFAKHIGLLDSKFTGGIEEAWHTLQNKPLFSQIKHAIKYRYAQQTLLVPKSLVDVYLNGKHLEAPITKVEYMDMADLENYGPYKGVAVKKTTEVFLNKTFAMWFAGGILILLTIIILF